MTRTLIWKPHSSLASTHTVINFRSNDTKYNQSTLFPTREFGVLKYLHLVYLILTASREDRNLNYPYGLSASLQSGKLP